MDEQPSLTSGKKTGQFLSEQQQQQQQQQQPPTTGFCNQASMTSGEGPVLGASDTWQQTLATTQSSPL